MNVIAYAFYRSPSSEYERADCSSATRGNFFRGYIRPLVRAHHSVWPDWALWIYHDDRVREFSEFALLERYDKAGLIRLIPAGEAPSLTGAMTWRLLPAFDPNVDLLLCRDLDSLPQPRERVAVERWIASGKPISGLHDSTSHYGTALLGGMCGFRCEWLRRRMTNESMRIAMEASGIDFDQKGGDQHFLNAIFHGDDILNEWVDPAAGPWDRDRNFCEGWARCVGGAYPGAEHVARWFDKHYPDTRIMEAER